MKKLSKKIHAIDTSEIRKAFELAFEIKNPKDLSIGQPDFPVPEPVKEALLKAVRENKNSYSPTQGILPLREALAEKYAKSNINVSPNDIIISTGVASILFLLFEVLFDKGDHILLTDPYFLIYRSLGEYHDLNIHYIPENFTQEDIDKFKKKNKNNFLKAIIFASPSNPTGKILDQAHLQKLGLLAQENDALLISDEIYEAFDYTNSFTHCAQFFPESTLTLGGFSKSHAMTGLRVGYLAAPKNLGYISDKVATLQQYSIVCSPQPAQWAALQALETPIEQELKLMLDRRNLVNSKLRDKCSFPSLDGAFYAFPNLPVDGKRFVQEAIKKELLVVPGHIFSRDTNTVRISYAQRKDILEEGLDIFCELLEAFNS